MCLCIRAAPGPRLLSGVFVDVETRDSGFVELMSSLDSFAFAGVNYDYRFRGISLVRRPNFRGFNLPAPTSWIILSSLLLDLIPSLSSYGGVFSVACAGPIE